MGIEPTIFKTKSREFCGSCIVNSGDEMTAKIIPFDQKQQALWAEYLAAKERAERTGDMQDGIDAGRAWARWLDLFAKRGAA